MKHISGGFGDPLYVEITIDGVDYLYSFENDEVFRVGNEEVFTDQEIVKLVKAKYEEMKKCRNAIILLNAKRNP